MLSIKRYSLLCLLGGEIVYTICMLYGFFLVGQTLALHQALFQLLPGFTGMNFISWLMGAITVAVWSLLGGTYIAWMHNYSLEK